MVLTEGVRVFGHSPCECRERSMSHFAVHFCRNLCIVANILSLVMCLVVISSAALSDSFVYLMLLASVSSCVQCSVVYQEAEYLEQDMSRYGAGGPDGSDGDEGENIQKSWVWVICPSVVQVTIKAVLYMALIASSLNTALTDVQILMKVIFPFTVLWCVFVCTAWVTDRFIFRELSEIYRFIRNLTLAICVESYLLMLLGG